MIETITDEQRAQFPLFVRKWTEIGLSTAPADRKRAEAGIVQAYKAVNLASLPRIIWCTSPLAMYLTRVMLTRDGASVSASVSASVYGQHESAWLGFYDVFGSIFGLKKQIAPLHGLMEIAQSAGWWLPMKSACLVSERHNILHRDDRGRLHAIDGPALAYPDGFSVYAVHGVRVPERVVMRKSSLTATEIRDESNAEIRRVMLDFYGAPRYLHDIGAQTIQKDEYGELLRADLPGDEPLVMVHVRDSSTAREYMLRVPPRVCTAREAVAWTFGMNEREYAPAVQT